jgi:argininosuccinate synthase
MPLSDLMVSLGTIAEAPAAVVLHQAHHALQARTTDVETDRVARGVSRRYAELVAHGGWFLPLRAALDGFVDVVQRPVTGVVTLQLLKTTCTLVENRPLQR